MNKRIKHFITKEVFIGTSKSIKIMVHSNKKDVDIPKFGFVIIANFLYTIQLYSMR